MQKDTQAYASNLLAAVLKVQENKERREALTVDTLKIGRTEEQGLTPTAVPQKVSQFDSTSRIEEDLRELGLGGLGGLPAIEKPHTSICDQMEDETKTEYEVQTSSLARYTNSRLGLNSGVSAGIAATTLAQSTRYSMVEDYNLFHDNMWYLISVVQLFH